MHISEEFGNIVFSIDFGYGCTGCSLCRRASPRKYKAKGAFPELWDKVKPEVDVIAIGKQMSDVIM